MKTIVPRLSHSRSSLARLYTIAETRNRKLLCTSSEKADEKEEGQYVNEKLLVLGGNGFVGSHICKEALKHKIPVSSVSRHDSAMSIRGAAMLCPRAIVIDVIKNCGSPLIKFCAYSPSHYQISWSGRPSLQDSWVDSVCWHKGDLLSPNSWKHALNESTSVISCVGGFGSNSHMYKINGTANINAITAAAEHGVKRFVYISVADFGLVNYLLKGYYDGKRATEAELTDRFPNGGVILRPGFIHGTRRIGKMKLPLSVIGAPLQLVLQHAKPLTQIPLIGPLFIPPVHVNSVAKVAVRAATDSSFPLGIVDVYGILQHSQDKSA